MLWVGVSSLTCSPRVWLSLVGQHESHGRDFANLDIVNTKSCQNPRIPVKIPPRNESTKSVSADRFFFFCTFCFGKIITHYGLLSDVPASKPESRMLVFLSSEISSLDLHYSTSKNRAFHGKTPSPSFGVYQVAHFSAFFNEMPFTEPPLSPTSLPDSLKWKVIPQARLFCAPKICSHFWKKLMRDGGVFWISDMNSKIRFHG